MVNKAPSPRPAIPARTGNATCDTTRKAAVRLTPEGVGHRDGHHRPHVRADLAHRRRAQGNLTAALGQMAGDRDEQHGPRSAVAATAPTVTLPIEISVPKPRLSPVTAGSCSRLRAARRGRAGR